MSMLPTALLAAKGTNPLGGCALQASNVWHEWHGMRDVVADAERQQATTAA